MCLLAHFAFCVLLVFPYGQRTELITHRFGIVFVYDASFFIFHFNNFTHGLFFGNFFQDFLLFFLLFLLNKADRKKNRIMFGLVSFESYKTYMEISVFFSKFHGKSTLTFLNCSGVLYSITSSIFWISSFPCSSSRPSVFFNLKSSFLLFRSFLIRSICAFRLRERFVRPILKCDRTLFELNDRNYSLFPMEMDLNVVLRFVVCSK